MKTRKTKTCLIVVAHPDDETLWAGGTLLSHPQWDCFIVSLCRKKDPDRAPKFQKVLEALGANGVMGDMNDDPEQRPIEEEEFERMVLKLLPEQAFDLVITHSPEGEYTRHLRHEETGTAVIKLWQNGDLRTKELWLFAYEDNDKAYLPRAVESATAFFKLSKAVWQQKYDLITQIYGFEEDSWEAKTTPVAEAFWQFKNSFDAGKWLNKQSRKS
ncbi:MAG: PIG-L family deacetylase [Imperialibacter sp.]|uniref:PIG-L deacetylase family protein n=1 Tax=Imperialibacter sp. TaxID=2038411 RepID=UPI0032EE8BA1